MTEISLGRRSVRHSGGVVSASVDVAWRDTAGVESGELGIKPVGGRGGRQPAVREIYTCKVLNHLLKHAETDTQIITQEMYTQDEHANIDHYINKLISLRTIFYTLFHCYYPRCYMII